MTTELGSFLKELAAELHITLEAAEQIWKDYHPSNKKWLKTKYMNDWREATKAEAEKFGTPVAAGLESHLLL